MGLFYKIQFELDIINFLYEKRPNCSLKSNFPNALYLMFVRRNGFTWPLHINQVLAILVFLTMFGLNIYLYTILSAILLLNGLLLVILILGIIITSSDPSKASPLIYYFDNRVEAMSPSSGGQLTKDSKNSSISLEIPYCLVCDKQVTIESLHCKYCNKCIQKLDHHCFYLNTCISKYNYTAYVTLLFMIFVYFAVLSYFNFQGMNWYYFGFAMPIALYNMYLLILHMYLIYHGLTTLEYSRLKKRKRGRIYPED